MEYVLQQMDIAIQHIHYITERIPERSYKYEKKQGDKLLQRSEIVYQPRGHDHDGGEVISQEQLTAISVYQAEIRMRTGSLWLCGK